MQKYILFSVLFVVSVVLDQATKIWVVNNIEYRYGEIEVIPGFFSLVHTQNAGAAFGIMQGQMLFFAVFTIIALGFVGYTLWELHENDKYQNIALSLIASGAVGNAIDRMDKQSVTDFLRVYTDHPGMKSWLIETFGTAEWPSFNVADSAIVIGLIMFGVHGAFFEEDSDEEEESIEPPKMLDGDT